MRSGWSKAFKAGSAAAFLLLQLVAHAEIPDTGFEYDGMLILKGSATKTRQEPDQGPPGRNTRDYVPRWEPGDIPPILGNKPYVPTKPSILKGNRLTDQYKIKAGADQFRRILEKDPNNPAAHNGLGKLYYEMTSSSNQDLRDQANRLYEQAVNEFLTALRFQPNYVEARVNLGNLFMDQGRFRDAEEEFRRALALAPNDSEANEKMGALLLKQGDVNGSLPYLEKAVQLKTDNASAHYYLGTAYTQRGEYSKALGELQTSLYQFPNSAPVHYQMGVVYELQGNGGAAVNAFQKSINIKPEFAPAGMQLAEHYRRRGDLTGSLEVMKNLLESYPDNDTLRFRVAQLSLKNNQPEVAAKYFTQILQDNPDDRQARQGLSVSEQRIAKQAIAEGDLSDRVEARQALRSAVGNNPDNLKARLTQLKLAGGARPSTSFEPGFVNAVLREPADRPGDNLTKGEVLLVNRRFDQAEREFEVSLRTVTSTADLLTLGEIFMVMGTPDKAEETFERVLAQSPDNAAALQGMREVTQARRKARGLVFDAKLHKEEHSPFRAIQLLDEALTLDQMNPETHRLLGQLYEKVERPDLAIEYYQAYLALEPTGSSANSVRDRIKRLSKQR